MARIDTLSTAAGTASTADIPHSLQDVVDAIRTADIPPRRRQDLASALTTLSRVSRRPLAETPANVGELKRLIASVSPALHGISRGRWRNISSLAFRALDLACVPRAPTRSATPLGVEWKTLLEQLPHHAQIPLQPFARFCTREGVVPGLVDQSTFDRFAAEVERSARLRPREALLKAIGAWNKARRRADTWPPFTATSKSRRKDYCLQWCEFPATLKADLDSMIAASRDPFAAGESRVIKASTAKQRVHAIRMLVAAMVHRGCAPGELRTLADVVAVDRVKEGLRYIYERNGSRRTTHLRNISHTVCVVAEHWVKVPEAHLTELKSIRRNVTPPVHGMTEKNRATLRHFDRDELITRLVNVPDQVWRRWSTAKKLSLRGAVELQVATAIAVLLVAPIRVGNLAELRLDQHIIDNGHGRARRVHLFLPAGEVKNEVDLEFEWPDWVVALLDRYMSEVRPRLLRAANHHLFPGRSDRSKTTHLLSSQIAKMVDRELGVRLSAHQFRHAAGYIYLKSNPGGHEVVRRLLGHRRIETTIRHYAGMEAADAVRHFDAVIEKRRSSAVVQLNRRTRAHA